MRITNRYMTNSIIQGIQQNLSNLARSQEQLATSKKLLRPSDEPNVLGQFMGIKGTLSYNEQYNKNIDDGLSYMCMNDSAMDTLGAILAKAGEYAVQVANGTYNEEDRAAVAAQIDKMIDQVVDLGNSTVGGKYIYAGTQNNRAPFERIGDKIIYNGNYDGIYREVIAGTEYRVDASGVTTGIDITAENVIAKSSPVFPNTNLRQTDKDIVGILKVTFDGTNVTVDNQLQLDGVTPDLSLVTAHSAGPVFQVTAGGLTGLQVDFTGCTAGAEYTIVIDNRLGVFGNVDITSVDNAVYDPVTAPAKHDADKGIFDALFALRDRLLADDTDGLQTSIGELQAKTDQLLQHRVEIGARTSHFESLKTMMLDQEVKLTDNLNQIEGADMARLSIEVNQQLLTYNASLASSSRLMQISLIDFLK